jgi:AraC-like DNA-binding protein
MEIKLYNPQNQLLQKYIECFYTLKRSSSDETISYLGFPSVNTFVVICNEAEVTLQRENITIVYSQNSSPKSVLIVDFEKSGISQYVGETFEITIYFKPLGLNAFLDKNLIDYKKTSVSFFNPFDDFQKKMTEIFLIEDDRGKIEALENYWLSKLKGFEHLFLEKVLAEMMGENDSPATISDIAKRNKISRTTLNKHFDLHVGTSPNQFKKIARFRNAMKRFAAKTSAENLVDISYLADYFDQSHMVKDFKSLTGYSPKAFFSKLSRLENGQINWLFL